MTKQQIINIAVAKITEMTVGVNVQELSRIITKVADLVEAETKKKMEAK